MIANANTSAIFADKPTLLFYPDINQCPSCKDVLHVLKTTTKTVTTLSIGSFTAKETVFFCSQDQKKYSSDQLRELVPKGGTFGFDIIVEVGLALFVRSRSNLEIMRELSAKNVFVSEREISYLGRKFVVYLAIAHRESQPGLRKIMATKGGYILHVDGTCEGNSPNLFCGIDGISELVLDTIKIPSEKKELLIPFFQDIKKQYGEPKALVHDMGRGILTAVESVFPNVADFICHFHFLRDIGKDLLEAKYTALQKRLQHFKVRSSLRQKSRYLRQKIVDSSHTKILSRVKLDVLQDSDREHIPLITAYTLIHWVFEYPRQSDGYGFPFDRPHLDFYRRLQTAHRLLGQIMSTYLNDSAKDNKPLIHLYNSFQNVVADQQLNELAESLEQRSEVFDKLRSAMRIALPNGKKGINDDGEDSDMKSIKKKVTSFRQWLGANVQRKTNYSNMIKQLDKYWEKLFADPLTIVTAQGVTYIQPQRTNNILERFFRGEKRRARKKTGTSSLNKVLKATLAKTPLVQNLSNAEYMKIILNGCSSLPERFAKIDAQLVQKEMASSKTNQEKILPEIKKLIKDSNLLTKIAAVFSVVT